MATRGLLEDPAERASLFGLLHEMEYRLLTDYGELPCCRKSGMCQQTEQDGEVLRLKRLLLDTYQRDKGLEELLWNLRTVIEATDRRQGTGESVSSPSICPAKSVDCPTDHTVSRLRRLLDQANYCNYELETENAQLKEEIEGLLALLGHYENPVLSAARCHSLIRKGRVSMAYRSV